VALVASACTPGGPAAQTFKVRPTAIKVVDGEDNDTGDEPYVIQVGFRSKVGVAKSSSAQISSQCRTGTLPTTEAPDGSTVAIPAGAADVNLAGVQNLDIGDIAEATDALHAVAPLLKGALDLAQASPRDVHRGFDIVKLRHVKVCTTCSRSRLCTGTLTRSSRLDCRDLLKPTLEI
jgi:hypothetical protein